MPSVGLLSHLGAMLRPSCTILGHVGAIFGPFIRAEHQQSASFYKSFQALGMAWAGLGTAWRAQKDFKREINQGSVAKLVSRR